MSHAPINFKLVGVIAQKKTYKSSPAMFKRFLLVFLSRWSFYLKGECWPFPEVLLEQLLHRLPALSAAQVKQMTNGPESFTPDAKWIMGRSPEVGVFVVVVF